MNLKPLVLIIVVALAILLFFAFLPQPHDQAPVIRPVEQQHADLQYPPCPNGDCKG